VGSRCRSAANFSAFRFCFTAVAPLDAETVQLDVQSV
jgi:hypothetical protein